MTENRSHRDDDVTVWKRLKILGVISPLVIYVVGCQFAMPAAQMKDASVRYTEKTLDTVAYQNESATSSPTESASASDRLVTIESTSASDRLVTIDILSIGSNTKEDFQDAQQRTFGSHPAVRNFVRVTEHDDFDQLCPTALTVEDIKRLSTFCKLPRENDSFIQYEMRKWLFTPKLNVGWVCAQKRPIDGLHNVIRQYREGLAIPDYVFIIDDDTYLNIDLLEDLLLRSFPPAMPSVTTGCVFSFLKTSQFRYPYGGFGSFLTKASVERLVQPIYCNGTNDTEHPIENYPSVDPFTRFACWRLERNLLGEAPYFRNGMSVIDLMYQFSAQQLFSASSNWTMDDDKATPGGYCLHSDHALGYFFDFYHIAVPDAMLRPMTEANDELRRAYSYQPIQTKHDRRGECKFERDLCTVHNLVCHYIPPPQMDALHRETQRRMENMTGIVAVESPNATQR